MPRVRLTAPGKFILVDEEQLRGDLGLDRAIPFLEKDGQWWGAPADDETALRELERLRQAGYHWAQCATRWDAASREYYASLRTELAIERADVCILLVDATKDIGGAPQESIVLGAGSQEILKSAIRAFCTPFRPLVTASPTFENPTGTARRMCVPVHEVKVDNQFRLNLEEMLAVVRGAGLVFLNNPNNPTATIHTAKVVQNFVERVKRISPDTVILIDEAYHEYVTNPEYATAIPMALAMPNVFVARTFSKAYGMAGMRIGYAIGDADTVKPLARLKMPYNVSVFGIAAAMAALNDAKHIDEETARNTEVRAFTVKALDDLGCKSSESQANFLFVDIGRPAADFRDACAKHGVLVGRDFPPFEKTHARISLGTMDEMRRAGAVFRAVLRPITSAGRER